MWLRKESLTAVIPLRRFQSKGNKHAEHQDGDHPGSDRLSTALRSDQCPKANHQPDGGVEEEEHLSLPAHELIISKNVTELMTKG